MAVCFCGIHCVKYVDEPLSAVQKLLMAKPWYLSYTDSVHLDSINVQHFYRIPATDCEKKEGVSFGQNFNYFMNLVCSPFPSDKLNGNWQYFRDSTIAYGSASDTGVTSILHIGYILMITPDSLRLYQQSDFSSPDAGFEDLYELKTYSH
jgi:hypothetical protein